jgi:hypothetical protein
MKYRIEEAPNRDALEFHVEKKLSESVAYFMGADMIDDDDLNDATPEGKELAKKLFHINGIDELYFGRYNVMVCKASVFNWDKITPEVTRIIKEVLSPDEDLEELEKVAMSDEEAAALVKRG